MNKIIYQVHNMNTDMSGYQFVSYVSISDLLLFYVVSNLLLLKRRREALPLIIEAFLLNCNIRN